VDPLKIGEGVVLLAAWWVVLLAVRTTRLDWREPTRKRGAVEEHIVNVYGPTLGRAWRRCMPVSNVFLIVVLLLWTLGLIGVHAVAVQRVGAAVLVLAALLIISILLTNRPRWAVPPLLRSERGLFDGQSSEDG
jgi:hypothetical protein